MNPKNQGEEVEVLQGDWVRNWMYYHGGDRITFFADKEEFYHAWAGWFQQPIIMNSIGKVYSSLTEAYNPLDNYNMREEEKIHRDTTDNRSDTHNDGHTIDYSGSDINVRSGQQSESDTRGTTNRKNAYNPSSSQESLIPIDTVNRNDGSVTTTYNDITDKLTKGTRDSYNGNFHGQISDVEEENSDRTLTRSGNIGVTTSQQMIQSELELRKVDLYNYFVQPFLDNYSFYTAEDGGMVYEPWEARCYWDRTGRNGGA